MKKIFLLTLFAISLSHSSSGQLNIEYWLNKGRDKIIREDNLGALEYFNTLIRMAPDIPDAYFLRAIAKYNLGDYRGSISDYSSAIKLHPIFSDYYLNRGKAKERINDYKGAFEDYNQAIDIRPVNMEAFASRGIIYLNQKRYDEALKDFDMAVRLDRKNSYAYLYRAIGKQYKQNFRDAIADFNRAIQLNPTNVEAYIRRGRNYSEIKDFKAAITDFNIALELDSTVSFAYFNRAVAKTEIFDLNGALLDFSKVIELDPDNDLSYFNRADLKSKMNDFEGAIEDYDKVLAINPNNVYTWFNRALLWHRQNNFAKAIADYSEAIVLNPEFATALYNRSLAKRSMGDLNGAKADNEHAAKINANYASKNTKDEIDTARLTNIMAFRADFDAGNIQVTKASESGFYPFSNFVATYIADKDKNFGTAPNCAELNELTQIDMAKGRFAYLNQDNEFPISNADDSIAALNSAGSGPKIVGLLKRAMLKSKSLRLTESLMDYDSIIALHPTIAAAYLNRATIRYEMQMLINSSLSATSDISYIGNSKNMTNMPAQPLEQNFAEVLSDLRIAAQTDSLSTYVWYNWANVLTESKEFSSAIKAYEKALSLDPKFAEAYYNKGLTHIYIKQNEAGCAALSKAGELGAAKAYGAIKKFCN